MGGGSLGGDGGFGFGLVGCLRAVVGAAFIGTWYAAGSGWVAAVRGKLSGNRCSAGRYVGGGGR